MAEEGRLFSSFIFCISEDPQLKQVCSFTGQIPWSSDLPARPPNPAPASSAWAGGHSGVLQAIPLLTHANMMFAFSTTSWQCSLLFDLRSARVSSCPCWRITSLPGFSCLHVPCSCPDWTPNLPFGSGTLFISRPFFPIYQDLFWIALLPFSELPTLPGSVCSEHLMLIFFISLALTISLNRASPRTNPRGAHSASLSILTADNLPRQSSQYRYTFLHGPFIRLPHSERSPLEVWGVV